MANFPCCYQALFFYRSFKVAGEQSVQFGSKYAAPVDTVLFIACSLSLLQRHAVVTLEGELFGC